MNYKESQTGWLLIGIFAVAILFHCLAYINQWGNNPMPIAIFLSMLALFIFILLLFYKLTLKIEDEGIKVIYGIGLIRITLRIDLLHHAEVIRTPWYYGLGIRFTPKGMLYNIQSRRAVRLDYQSGKKRKTVMLGTTQPEQLKKFLERRFASS